MTNPAHAGDAQIAFGAWLRRQREERGIPVDEIADLTRLPASRIVALEDGHWDVFGATTYLRGAVRAYATAIGLDADATLLKLEADGLGGGIAEPWVGLTDRNNPLFREDEPQPKVDLRRVLLVSVVVAGLAALAAGIAHLYTLPIDPGPVREQTPTTRAAAQRPKAAPATTPVSPPVEVAPPPLHRLHIRALDEVWLKAITDGGPPREWTLPAGRTMAIEATSEVNFLTGNAGGLVLQLDDGPEFSLGVSGEVRRRVFRFPQP